MFNVEIGSLEKIFERFDTMHERIETFGTDDMPQGLTDWQINDMHRKYPETKMVPGTFIGEVSAETDIFPRSRTYNEAHHPRKSAVASRAARPLGKPLSSLPRLIAARIGRRPILRLELFAILIERMNALLSEKIKWR